MGQDVHGGVGFASVLVATPDLGLQQRLREDLGKANCAVLPLASLDETGRAAVVLRFDRIILDLALCHHTRDLADFTARLEPGQQLVLLQDPERAFPEEGLNPRCLIRSVPRSSHPGILLTRLRKALDSASRSLRIGSLTPKNLSILLVDPDPIAQDLVLQNLLSLGYLVLCIPNPVEAAHTAEDLCIDVLMVDAMLPFGGARKLANSLCRINPRLKVLFLSNHPTELLTSSGVCPPGAQVLRKPLRRRDILDALELLVKAGTEWKQLPAGGPRPPAKAEDGDPEDTPGRFPSA